MLTRKNVRSLVTHEMSNYSRGVHALGKIYVKDFIKKYSEYSWLKNGTQKFSDLSNFTVYHALVLQHCEVFDKKYEWPPSSGNGTSLAHEGPAFLPWHRAYLMFFEKLLGIVLKQNFALPYWNWGQDEPDPLSSVIWQNNFLGGNGDNSGIVRTGPFRKGNWTTITKEGIKGDLNRSFGESPFARELPTLAEIGWVLDLPYFDEPPYCNLPDCKQFRNYLEGWVSPSPSDYTFMHNRVHMWVGGNMESGTSPNDPVFWLHHCFVDKLWDIWMQLKPNFIYPNSGAPPFQNLNEKMYPWNNITPADVIKWNGIYQYDNNNPDD